MLQAADFFGCKERVKQVKGWLRDIMNEFVAAFPERLDSEFVTKLPTDDAEDSDDDSDDEFFEVGVFGHSSALSYRRRRHAHRLRMVCS